MQFDESQFKIRSRRLLGEPQVPGMIRFLVTKGIVKTEKQAVGAMLTVVGVLIVATIWVVRINNIQPAVFDPEYISSGTTN